jgi:hypothetical protein
MPLIAKEISQVIASITGGLDELITSKEERDILRNQLYEMKYSLVEKAMEAELRILESRTQIITAEAKGESWLQRSWRPITALTFLVLIVLHHLGFLQIEITDQMWDLLQIMIGGYVVSRGIEKAVPAAVQAIRPPNQT